MADFIDSLYDDVVAISKGLVVKREDMADKNETMASIMAYERHNALIKNRYDKYAFIKYDEDILRSIVPSDIVYSILGSAYLLPEEYFIPVMDAHYDRYVTNYEDQNNYYRMLNGIPDLNDYSFVYVISDGIDPNTPIHLLSESDILTIYYSGVLDEIIKNNPTKKYLKFLGHKKIDPLVARKAKHFEILSLPDTKQQISKKLFSEEYYKSLKFHMITAYHKDIFRMNDSYDDFFSLMIIFSAISATISVDQNILMTDEVIELILESYGLSSYFTNMPSIYKRRLIKNISKLISLRGSDRVLVDICELFGYTEIVANRYYHIKRHNRDEAGNFIFPKLPDGTPDYDSMYSIDFLKSDVQNQFIEVDTSNVISYDKLVVNDPLWQLSNDELSRLKSEDFNIMMSKYIGIEAAYDISGLIYEATYFLNLILESRELSKLSIVNSYSTSAKSDLFTSIIFVFSLMCKLAKFDGNILVDPVDIAQIYRFNLEALQSDVQALIDKYNLDIKATDVMLARPTAIFDDSSYITDVYIYNTNIREKLEKAMSETSSQKEYLGLLQIKELLFTSAQIQKCYKLKNGQVATTYQELLNDLDASLFLSLSNLTTDSELENAITYTLMAVQSLFDTDKLKFLFINTPDMHDYLIKTHFSKMINLFKASSVELGSVDIIFYMRDIDSPIKGFFDYTVATTHLFVDSTITYEQRASCTYFIHVVDEMRAGEIIRINN